VSRADPKMLFDRKKTRLNVVARRFQKMMYDCWCRCVTWSCQLRFKLPSCVVLFLHISTPLKLRVQRV
jgi:hypothetical protein